MISAHVVGDGSAFSLINSVFVFTIIDPAISFFFLVYDIEYITIETSHVVIIIKL